MSFSFFRNGISVEFCMKRELVCKATETETEPESDNDKVLTVRMYMYAYIYVSLNVLLNVIIFYMFILRVIGLETYVNCFRKEKYMKKMGIQGYQVIRLMEAILRLIPSL